MKLEVLGVKIDQVNLPQAVSLVESWLKQDKKHYIVTVNPEFVMQAQKDSGFKQIVNQADLAIPDGSGLRLADKRFTRVAGTDLMLALVKKGYKTVLAGARPGVAEKAAETLKTHLVGLPTRRLLVGMSEPDIKEINKIKPDLLFVALGMGKQEKWIVKNLPKLKVKVAMGVGGALDQIAKPWLRAPVCLRALGLEWLYRLILQPWRIKRQWQLLRFLLKIYL
ncbi:MAG: WecB/TagA/CpsF family glycosyltransferase [Candidatus Beckwithbacteria bacterium]